jgi:hypothetical protein
MGAKIPASAAVKRQRRAEEDDDGAPLLATSSAFDAPATMQGRVYKSPSTGKRNGAGHAGHTSARKPGAINLKTVAQACIDAGLDPAAEIARVLATQVPVLDAKGAQVFDKDGKAVTTGLIDTDTKIRTLTELLQYNQPKLKAVEMKISGTLEMTGDELDQRLSALLSKAVSK